MEAPKEMQLDLVDVMPSSADAADSDLAEAVEEAMPTESEEGAEAEKSAAEITRGNLILFCAYQFRSPLCTDTRSGRTALSSRELSRLCVRCLVGPSGIFSSVSRDSGSGLAGVNS
jgi:hypothetical protein